MAHNWRQRRGEDANRFSRRNLRVHLGVPCHTEGLHGVGRGLLDTQQS